MRETPDSKGKLASWKPRHEVDRRKRWGTEGLREEMTVRVGVPGPG